MINPILPSSNIYYENKEDITSYDEQQPKKTLFSNTQYTPYGNPYVSKNTCKILFPAVSLLMNSARLVSNKDFLKYSFKQSLEMMGKNFSERKFIATKAFGLIINAFIAYSMGVACDKLGNYKRAYESDLEAVNASQEYY